LAVAEQAKVLTMVAVAVVVAPEVLSLRIIFQFLNLLQYQLVQVALGLMVIRTAEQDLIQRLQ